MPGTGVPDVEPAPAQQVGTGLVDRTVAGVDQAVALLLGAGSAVRHARVFHPVGDAYRAELTLSGTADTGAAVLDTAGSWPAVVRLSRAAGLPAPLPDCLGLAVRLPDRHGPGRPQDLLVNTAVGVPGLRHLFAPRIGPLGRTYSSVLPYRAAGQRLMLGARPHGAHAFTLLVASVTGRWRPVGTLQLGDRLDAAVAVGLRFDVDHTGGGLAPDPLFHDLRRRAYAVSQQRRP